jgi:hypothetical protein
MHGDPADDRVARMLVDHVRIRAQARRLEQDGAPPVEELHAVGTTLERHVRLEEREVFPLIEDALPLRSGRTTFLAGSPPSRSP